MALKVDVAADGIAADGVRQPVVEGVGQAFTDAAAGEGCGVRGDLAPGDASIPPEHRRRGRTMLKLTPPPILPLLTVVPYMRP
jgi:hypothetical protein